MQQTVEIKRLQKLQKLQKLWENVAALRNPHEWCGKGGARRTQPRAHGPAESGLWGYRGLQIIDFAFQFNSNWCCSVAEIHCKYVK